MPPYVVADPGEDPLLIEDPSVRSQSASRVFKLNYLEGTFSQLMGQNIRGSENYLQRLGFPRGCVCCKHTSGEEVVPTEAEEDESNNYWPNYNNDLRKQGMAGQESCFSGPVLSLPKKKEARMLLALLLVAVAGVSIYAAYLRIVATKVSTITAGVASSPSSWNGRALHGFGSVDDHGDNEITIAEGTGSVEVTWFGTLPSERATYSLTA